MEALLFVLVLFLVDNVEVGSNLIYGLAPHILHVSTVRFTPGYDLSSSYTTCAPQTLETSADTANLCHCVRGQNLQ